MIKESKVYKILRYIFLFAACIFVIIPIIPLIFMAFKTGAEYSATGVLTPPKNWLNGYNFNYAIRVGNLGKALLNTAIILGISLSLQIMFTTMVSYVLHRFKFRGRKIIMTLFTLTMFIPVVTTQTVVFQIIYRMHLVNKMASVILLYSGVGIIGIYIMFNLLDSISKELDESALLDGAGYFTIYRKIILPLLKPACTTLLILNGIGYYNDFYIPNLYLRKDVQTFTVALYKFFGSMSTPFEIVAAAILLGIIPIGLVYIFLQKYIFYGLAGAIKS
ncbi:carbohydrate ABC transporter permease [Anaerocolumna sp. AGMB13020]|uniref:carbohydrate ABC transporter permease n=1 Tax=Anaerocolumna sp. AGMB13020 TaxID=3081750 RepID=UPI002953A13A|nr:carbohydrate ABC transporter permease [Anaerocolumna sp. AGMB13020]WOO34547.1 carbohydrate ABC transporter permease [Anaerocolumna sp. AGMB13020]